MPISYIVASGKDIAEIVNNIENAVDGHQNVHVSIACLIVAIMAQNPEISPEHLQNCVKGVSEYLAASIFERAEGVN